jgi:hypothetical protein
MNTAVTDPKAQVATCFSRLCAIGLGMLHLVLWIPTAFCWVVVQMVVQSDAPSLQNFLLFVEPRRMWNGTSVKPSSPPEQNSSSDIGQKESALKESRRDGEWKDMVGPNSQPAPWVTESQVNEPSANELSVDESPVNVPPMNQLPTPQATSNFPPDTSIDLKSTDMVQAILPAMTWPPAIQPIECGAAGNCAFFTLAQQITGHPKNQRQMRNDALNVGLELLGCKGAPSKSLDDVEKFLKDVYQAKDLCQQGQSKENLGKKFPKLTTLLPAIAILVEEEKKLDDTRAQQKKVFIEVKKGLTAIQERQKKSGIQVRDCDEQQSLTKQEKAAQDAINEAEDVVSKARSELAKQMKECIRKHDGMQNFGKLLLNNTFITSYCPLTNNCELGFMNRLLTVVRQDGKWGDQYDILLTCVHHGRSLLSYIDAELILFTSTNLSNYRAIRPYDFEPPKPVLVYDDAPNTDGRYPIKFKWEGGAYDGWAELWDFFAKQGKVSGKFPKLPTYEDLNGELCAIDPLLGAPTMVAEDQMDSEARDQWTKEQSRPWAECVQNCVAYTNFVNQFHAAQVTLVNLLEPVCAHSSRGHWRAFEFQDKKVWKIGQAKKAS